MSAEAEAVDIVFKIIDNGVTILAKTSGTAAIGLSRALLYLYAVKKGGLPREIALNPNGMSIVTIPEDKLQEFKQACKKYHIKFFTANLKDYEKGYIDINCRTEDLSNIKRILDKMEVTYIAEKDSVNVLDQESKLINNGKTFEEVSANFKDKAQDFNSSFDRKTDKDFPRDEPYYLVNRLKPDNYIAVLPEQDTFNGKNYTKSTYSIFTDGKFKESVDDGRFKGREKDYWSNLKGYMQKSGKFGDDMIYIRDVENLNQYIALYKGDTNKTVELNENLTADQLAEKLSIALDEVKPDQVPLSALESQTTELKSGQKIGQKDNYKTEGEKINDNDLDMRMRAAYISMVNKDEMKEFEELSKTNAASPGGVKDFTLNYDKTFGVTPEMRSVLNDLKKPSNKKPVKSL